MLGLASKTEPAAAARVCARAARLSHVVSRRGPQVGQRKPAQDGRLSQVSHLSHLI